MYHKLAPVKLENPTSVLRWSSNGVLQQKWVISETIDGRTTINYEWRDIPKE